MEFYGKACPPKPYNLLLRMKLPGGRVVSIDGSLTDTVLSIFGRLNSDGGVAGVSAVAAASGGRLVLHFCGSRA